MREDYIHTTKIILFGSYAQGQDTGESDIDIVIVSK
ncbi:MAG: nucleotidyltransferase domain-containing protein, partial [Syntrophobacterales bacterium]|nr:nucleotidyltransferase domain-containing protein [Syntrophobacterales bacterium]